MHKEPKATKGSAMPGLQKERNTLNYSKGFKKNSNSRGQWIYIWREFVGISKEDSENEQEKMKKINLYVKPGDVSVKLNFTDIESDP